MKLREPCAEELQEYTEWTASRPPSVKKIAEKIDPWTLYVLGETNQLVTVNAISEDSTIRVTAWCSLNGFNIMYPRGVFGIDPADLTPAPPGTAIPAPLQEELDAFEAGPP